MEFVLANILVIWDGRCDFFGSLSVSGRIKGGVKKKSRENLPFFVFFLKNDQILTNTKSFKIRFFFHRNVQTSPQHPFKHISNNFGVKYAYLDIILEFLQHLWKKNQFLRKIEIFFLKRFTVVFEKNNFFIFLLFWNNL